MFISVICDDLLLQQDRDECSHTAECQKIEPHLALFLLPCLRSYEHLRTLSRSREKVRDSRELIVAICFKEIPEVLLQGVKQAVEFRKPFLVSFYNDAATIMRIAYPSHKPFALEPVKQARHRGGCYSRVMRNFPRSERTEPTQQKERLRFCRPKSHPLSYTRMKKDRGGATFTTRVDDSLNEILPLRRRRWTMT